MQRTWQKLWLYGITVAVVALDQLSKYIVRTNLPYGGTYVPIPALRNVFDITHTTNTGAAFGLFPQGGMIFTVVALVVTVVIVYYNHSLPADQWLVRTVLGLQLGGAIGNLTDRLLFGTVTDFIHVHNFPVFNVADSSISLGVAILVVLMYLESRQHRTRAAGDALDGSTSESTSSATPDAPA